MPPNPIWLVIFVGSNASFFLLGALVGYLMHVGEPSMSTERVEERGRAR